MLPIRHVEPDPAGCLFLTLGRRAPDRHTTLRNPRRLDPNSAGATSSLPVERLRFEDDFDEARWISRTFEGHGVSFGFHAI